ncbi:hypothetical protein LWI29_037959 [Acer saccharum]|uniref:Neprosin PEP catalytic domain-containing protein n=1 Tax=Acer saccharum TaxID=4024 RepID=A0AA39W1H2_ACESA|nr:hypothetical protein LWI29_037959 [Acer saccharum]
MFVYSNYAKEMVNHIIVEDSNKKRTWGSVRAEEELGPRSSTCDRGIRSPCLRGGGVCSGTWGSVRAEEELGPRSSTCDRGIRRIKSLLEERPEGSTVLWSIGGRRSLGLTGWVRCDVRSMDSSWISTGSCSSCDERSGVTACDGLCSNNAVSVSPGTAGCPSASGASGACCSGFVQIDPFIAIGGSIDPVSIYNGLQREIQFIVRKDQITGNWWLKVGDRIVGYWPNKIFNIGLHVCGTEIKWGGAVLNKNIYNHHTATQMGSGHFPGEGFGKASFIRNLGYYDYSNNLVTKGLYIDSIYATRPSCYDVKIGDHGAANYGTHLYFGGSGFSMDCL